MDSKTIVKFNSLILKVLRNNKDDINLDPKRKKQLTEFFVKQGWYDGEILACCDCNVKENTLFLKCKKEKFFNLAAKRRYKKNPPKLIGLNTIIEVEDSIILIKRDPKVYDYQGYWDFPAGMAIFRQTFKERLIDRIENDTGLTEYDLEIDEKPFLAELIKPSVNLFYRAECKLSKQEVEKILKQKFCENTPILLKKKDIPDFLRKNKAVFPEVLLLNA